MAPRLPDSTHVGAVRLQVTDLERSLAYYTAAIGLDVGSQTSTRAALHASGEPEPLLILEQRAGTRPVPRGGLLGLYHFAILLPDRSHLGRYIRHLATTGVRFSAADHLVSEALYLWDPDGLGIEVYADRPREAWRMRGDELVMTTESLDLHALVDAAGPDPWQGLPIGTTMGHMHLSVGDLDAARAFYHSALGLDLRAWSYTGALFLSAGGYHHHLGVNTWAAHTRIAGPDDARLLEWRLVLPSVEDVKSAAARLEAAGNAVQADGDARIVVDPWNTAMRLTHV